MRKTGTDSGETPVLFTFKASASHSGAGRGARLSWPVLAVAILCAWSARTLEFSEHGFALADNVAYAKGGGGAGNGGGHGEG